MPGRGSAPGGGSGVPTDRDKVWGEGRVRDGCEGGVLQGRVVLLRIKVTVGRVWEKGRVVRRGVPRWHGMWQQGRLWQGTSMQRCSFRFRNVAGACRGCTGALCRLFCGSAFLHRGFRVSVRSPWAAHQRPPRTLSHTFSHFASTLVWRDARRTWRWRARCSCTWAPPGAAATRESPSWTERPLNAGRFSSTLLQRRSRGEGTTRRVTHHAPPTSSLCMRHTLPCHQ